MYYVMRAINVPIRNDSIPAILDEGIIMSSIGLTTVYHYANQFVVDMIDIHCRRRCDAHAITDTW